MYVGGSRIKLGLAWDNIDDGWSSLARSMSFPLFPWQFTLTSSRIGIPLPPFPAPTHGPPKSGLKRYVSIEDALKVVERQSLSFKNDPYHQPQLEKRLDLQATDPHINLAKCITTSGGDNVHYSGKRANTVRELASFQGFRPDFHFTGSVTEAKKQCGNAWPVKANRAYFAIWAAHREAFNDGLINAEDEVLDLYDFLETKGITIPQPLSIDVDLLDLGVNLINDSPRRTGIREPEYRYLPRIEKTVRPLFPLSLWGKGKAIDPLPQRRKDIRTSRISDRMSNGRDQVMDIISTRRRRRIPVYIDDDKEPTWIEESD
jgi:DNA (cytosine-5)-methyltransferase 1